MEAAHIAHAHRRKLIRESNIVNPFIYGKRLNLGHTHNF